MKHAPVDQLLKNPVSFLDDSGPDDDIAISSRIRLARNIGIHRLEHTEIHRVG